MRAVLVIFVLLVVGEAVKGKGNGANRSQGPIRKVITLMMENHSFDNLLGFLPGVGKLGGGETYTNVGLDGVTYPVKEGSDFCTIPDPAHSLGGMTEQIYGKPLAVGEPTMGGYARSFQDLGGSPPDVLNGYSPSQLPVLSALATNYTTLDHFFCSFPGPTGVNRLFVHQSSTCSYEGSNANVCYTDFDPYGSTFPVFSRSIEEDLEAEGYSFEIHYHDFTTAHGIEPLATQHANRFIYDLEFSTFYDELRNGSLPDYTFLVPLIFPMEDRPDILPATQHPSYDIRGGEIILKQVYEALRTSPYWDETLLIVTYDESGGFWDSVPPPTNVSSPCASCRSQPDSFSFQRLGPRIPTILISPWVDSRVVDTVFETASIPASVRQIFGLSSPPLSPRSAEAATFESLFRTEPRTDTVETLPPVSSEPPNFCSYKDDVYVGRGSWPGLAGEHILMYEELLEHHGVAHLSPSTISSDYEAGEWLRTAAALL
eukprot:CAMPEP_0119124030 /NCGR_PEP_ID=MMETSP1310-20130426/3771_1 /TAXON_ID=464262 /ORGANISM="Genus nov. species nov., Strain RCC2339" /LENGTH=485 /DNA_ID=CAMNT_0007113917 /DNA_START=81 /DNA_END=1534 /DNA_ORIENTATION=+